jgi:hypothetical protein
MEFEDAMDLDIRLPIGYFFGLTGVMLTVFGAVSGLNGSPIYEQHSLGINVNLWWGIVLMAFGLFMLMLARRAKREALAKVPKTPSNAA